MAERLTQAQLDGLRRWAIETGIGEGFAYLAERDDEHDSHLFVRIFRGHDEVAGCIVEGDGRVDDGR